MDVIRAHLNYLYGPEQGEQAFIALQAMLEKVNIRQRDMSLTEKDIALITYGDTLQREGEAPLATLHNFLRARLAALISIVHILPFFPYSSDDGFSIQDYYRVNPELGTWENISAIAKDFRLMVDLVLNHMSAESEWFRAFLADNPEYVGMFLTMPPNTDLSSVTRPRPTPLLTPFQKADGETVHVWTTFSADQVDFDYGNPQTLLRMIAVLLFYVEQGASVIRLDAIAYLWKEVGTSSIHLEQVHRVVQLFRAIFEEVAPHVIIITETNVPHAENVSYFGDGTNEAHMVYNFTLPPLLLHTMRTGNAVALREWMNTLSTPSDQTSFFNFTASHDGIGVRPLEGILSDEELDALVEHVQARKGRVSYKTNTDGSQSPYELNIAYVDAVADPKMPSEVRAKQFLVSQAIMLTMAGLPAIYIHSLIGTHNDLEGLERLGYNRAINRPKLQVEQVEDALNTPGFFRRDVFEGYAGLIRVRRQQAAFHPNGAQVALDVSNDGVLCIQRDSPDGSQRILALHNVTAQSHKIHLDIEHGYDLILEAEVSGDIQLRPYGTMWVEVR